MRYYAGIGSRETPDNILELMSSLAVNLFNRGYILRSGSAPGADQAFEFGLANAEASRKQIQRHAQIFLPWAGFQKDTRSWIKPCLTEPEPMALSIAEVYHPRFKYLKYGAKLLMGRNTHQIYGPDFDDVTFSDFVVCWTKDAKGGGGTGQAIRIAKNLNIPVYDLASEQDTFKLRTRLDGSFII